MPLDRIDPKTASRPPLSASTARSLLGLFCLLALLIRPVAVQAGWQDRVRELAGPGGVMVEDAFGRVLFSHNPDKALVPAWGTAGFLPGDPFPTRMVLMKYFTFALDHLSWALKTVKNETPSHIDYFKLK